MTLLDDLEEFVHNHRSHGALTGDATEPEWNGYLLTVVCPCGVGVRKVGHAGGSRARSAATRSPELNRDPIRSGTDPSCADTMAN